MFDLHPITSIDDPRLLPYRTMRRQLDHFEQEIFIAEGDKVVVRGTMTGTHSAEFMGIPATGKQVKISGIDVTRFHEGQSVEHWGQWDVAGLMQQLGVMPPPPGAPESE